MAGLSQHLFALGRPNLERQLAHPTVRGIATGDLEPTRFRSWLVQDYLFLLDYVRLFALAAARAADTDTLGRLVDLAHATLHEELSLHRAYAAEFGLAQADLDRAEKSPQCAAYDGVLEGLAALYAAERAYLDTWTAVAERSPADSPHHTWIQNWSGEAFRAFVTALGRDLDELAGAPSPTLTERLGVLFTGAARFELAFWEMCWSSQAWPG
jgi:thiaminase/transcriptional activator TenA